MYNLDKIYRKKYFSMKSTLNWRVPIVCDAIISILHPTSLIDLGCGNGDLAKGFLDRGVDAYGIEGTENARCKSQLSSKRLGINDLRYSTVFLRQFDLAICLEVAEHIEQEYADIFVDNLLKASDRILLSAAGITQRGIGHVNCQPVEYWLNKMSERGMCPDFCIAEKIKEKLFHWRNKKGIKAYYQNLLYFARRE